MKHRQHYHGKNRDLYEEYYTLQNGGEIPVFRGRRFQHGHGLAGIFARYLGRNVVPFLASQTVKLAESRQKTRNKTVKILINSEENIWS